MFLFFLIILIFFTLFFKYLEFLASFAFFFLVKRNTSHFDTHSHVKKGINQKRSVFVFHDWALQKAYLFIFFSVKAHSSVCRMLKGTWHIILGEKVHAWSTQISLFSTSFIPYQAVSSVCMWLFKKNFIFRFIAASLACILVRLLSNAHPVSVRVASRKKKISQMAQSSRRTEK